MQSFEFEFEGEFDQDEEVERELGQEAESQTFEDLRCVDAQRARLLRLEDTYFGGGKAQTFWRLRYHGWTPGVISILECLRRLHTLLDQEDARITYESSCDIESRLYQGRRWWA